MKTFLVYAKHRIRQMDASRKRVENSLLNALFESERRALILTLRDLGESIHEFVTEKDHDWLRENL